MDIILAFKAFFKALRDTADAKKFLEREIVDIKPLQENTHLRLLALLQKEGRFVDFLKEDIGGYTDAQIGAAMRKTHSECSKLLEEFVTLRPLFNESEGSKVTVPQGFDSNAIKVVGRVKGDPPYQGILRHKGWIAHKISLPAQVNRADCAVVCPAEIEVS